MNRVLICAVLVLLVLSLFTEANPNTTMTKPTEATGAASSCLNVPFLVQLGLMVAPALLHLLL